MLQLTVDIFQPLEGNYMHWAFHIWDEGLDQHYRYEVLNHHPDFKASATYEDPAKDHLHRREIIVDRVLRNDFEKIKACIKEVRVDNETVHWNCQDYCLEILEKLVEAFILDEDDEAYQAAKEELDQQFGGQI
jgi:hypothetical protein